MVGVKIEFVASVADNGNQVTDGGVLARVEAEDNPANSPGNIGANRLLSIAVDVSEAEPAGVGREADLN